eukprot:3933719-Rhodomonas_salina.1
MKGEWLKEWWKPLSVGFLHFSYAEGCIVTAEPLLLGFPSDEARTELEARIDGSSSQTKIGLMRNMSMVHNTALHITHVEMPKREFMDLARTPNSRNGLDFSNPNGPG